MQQNKYRNYRIGAFAAVNNGGIRGCSANISFKAKHGGSGFVYDNRGEIVSSVSVKAIKGRGEKAGFAHRTSQNPSACGFIAGPAKEKKNNKDSGYRDEALRLDSSMKTADIYYLLGLDTQWKNPTQDSLEPAFVANHAVVESSQQRVEIWNVEDLLTMIRDVNDGDQQAAGAYYVLMENLNLRGKKLDPIGSSESTAFTGIFDGNGKTVSNFTINAKGREYAGFFGVTRDAVVVNLRLDCILQGNAGNVTGGMVAVCNGGRIENCAVCIHMTPSVCCGGFVGKNSGLIVNCYVCGKIAFPILLWPLLLLVGLLLLLGLGWLLSALFDRGQNVYVPEVIDPNQVPVINTGNVAPPPAGTNRISFEMNQEVYVSAETQVGKLGYVNPARGTMDSVIRICISDSELIRAGYEPVSCGVRTVQEQMSPGYDPNLAFTELYRSGRIQIGYSVDNCKLSALPNGMKLGVGTYEMIVMIDGYDPETFEKSIINTQVPITVEIV